MFPGHSALQIETILPGENGAGSTLHVYRVYSTRIPTGPVRLGPSRQGELPYIVLLKGGRPVRSTLTRRLSGRIHRGGHRGGLRGGLHGQLRRSERRVRPFIGDGPRLRGLTGGSSVGSGLSLMAGGGSGDGFDADGELSWQLEPQYRLGEASRGLATIAKEVDKQAGNAARAALKVAAFSTISGGGDGASGVGGAGADGTKQPRLRFKVSVSVAIVTCNM